GRIVQRTCELLREHRTDDVRTVGGIDLPTLQKYLNFHCSVSLDLFGSEISTNAANFYTNGLKGRFEEGKKADGHQLKQATYPVSVLEGGGITTSEEAALTALNERLRDDYIADCARGVARWNQILDRAGMDFRFTLPHRGFHRAIGLFASTHVSPDGRVVSEAEWAARRDEWLPSESDRAYVISLMKPVVEPGKFAHWIALPPRGINGLPIDFDYVRLT
ncbi:MAG TPA: benzoyl-CoA 2,3-epoxidase subunit BoxB, partial [Candidatus Limnocylindria bacterium]|nr:benzoyl-CoA 2,3-epoxidase subunit BoxB [Candidatus Limnocylindria bacterium]